MIFFTPLYRQLIRLLLPLSLIMLSPTLQWGQGLSDIENRATHLETEEGVEKEEGATITEQDMTRLRDLLTYTASPSSLLNKPSLQQPIHQEQGTAAPIFPIFVLTQETGILSPHKLLYVAPLLSGGLYSWMLHGKKENILFQSRQAYLPHFRSWYDDALQYAPFALKAGFYIAGQEGRSPSAAVALTGDAIGIALATGVVNAMKYTIGRLRPDGSTRTSFPSGHTATAFLGATLFDLEYGHRYPWITALNYAVATSVGVGRVLNNRHWASDVSMGAGIGIMAAHYGYILAQQLWGLSEQEQEAELSDYRSINSYRMENRLVTGLSGVASFFGAVKSSSMELGIDAALLREFHYYGGRIGLRSERITSSSDSEPHVRSTLLLDARYGSHIVRFMRFSLDLIGYLGVAIMPTPSQEMRNDSKIVYFWPRAGAELALSAMIHRNRSMSLFTRMGIEGARAIPTHTGAYLHRWIPAIEFGWAYRFLLPLS